MIHYRGLWRQIWGLTALLTAVVLGFQIYGLFQPQVLLAQGFAGLVGWLDLFQAVLVAILEPALGYVSDRMLHRVGSRLPQITVGVTLAALIFVVSAVLMPFPLPDGVRLLVPLLMTLWIVAMIAFRGPVVAMLRQMLPVQSWPQASGLVVVLLAVAGGLGPLLAAWLDQVGVTLAFIAGAAVLLGGGFLLYRTAPAVVMPNPADRLPGWGVLARLWLMGWGVGVVINLALTLMPTFLRGLGASAIIQASGLMVAGLSGLVWGMCSVTQWHLGGGLVALVGSVGLGAWFGQQPWAGVLVLVWGLALGLVFTSSIPWVFSQVQGNHVGLSVGLYLGAGSLGSVLTTWSWGGEATGYLLAGGLVLALIMVGLSPTPDRQPFASSE